MNYTVEQAAELWMQYRDSSAPVRGWLNLALQYASLAIRSRYFGDETGAADSMRKSHEFLAMYRQEIAEAQGFGAALTS